MKYCFLLDRFISSFEIAKVFKTNVILAVCPQKKFAFAQKSIRMPIVLKNTKVDSFNLWEEEKERKMYGLWNSQGLFKKVAIFFCLIS